MCLFSNSDEKLKKQQEKEAKELQAFMDKYNLDTLNTSDLKVLRRISSDLAGDGLFKIGMALSFTKAEEQAKITYLSALVEQNWLIIKQLGSLNNKLDTIIEKDLIKE